MPKFQYPGLNNILMGGIGGFLGYTLSIYRLNQTISPPHESSNLSSELSDTNFNKLKSTPTTESEKTNRP